MSFDKEELETAIPTFKSESLLGPTLLIAEGFVFRSLFFKGILFLAVVAEEFSGIDLSGGDCPFRKWEVVNLPAEERFLVPLV